MRDVVDYWRTGFDWRAVEARLNRFAHYRLPVDGRVVHAIVEPGSGDNPLPVLLTHGWPGSFVEFADLIEPLAHPERFGGRAQDGLTVVVASLPGYGLSDPPAEPIGPREVAGVWQRLMAQTLGFERFGAHGSDWGAAVTSWLAYDFPQNLAAIHLTMPILRADGPFDPPLDPEEEDFLGRMVARLAGESGYQAIQGTKPQTLSYGLTDSPAGLAAWILEKFQGWTASYGTGRPPAVDLEHLLTNVMLYWLAGPNAASWMYRFLVDGSAFLLPSGGRIETPTGLCLFPDDVALPAPDRYGRRTYNVVSRTLAASGGHFPGLDASEALVMDLRAFFTAHGLT
jgi:microsomal epoxide hydrolase